MPRIKFSWKQKIVKISEQQQFILSRLLETGRFATEADIFRAGIAELERRWLPAYLQPTPAGSEKIAKAQKERAFQSIPDEQFVVENLTDVMVYADEDQKKWVLFHKIGNYIGAVPLDLVKDWVKREDPEFMYHKQIAGQDSNWDYNKILTDPLETSIRKILAEQYGVAISVEI